VAQAATQVLPVLLGEEGFAPTRMLQPAESLARQGYSLPLLAAGDFTRWLEVDDQADPGSLQAVPLTEAGDPDPDWRMVSAWRGAPAVEAAFDYVNFGPEALRGLPHLELGRLTAVDRPEIEAYQNVKALIADYAVSPDRRPLCLAVFGPAGSGQAFALGQVAESVLPGRVRQLRFAVSQFRGDDDLVAAFQQARDVALAGQLPLLVFDHFEADRDGRPAGWLKSFLQPMRHGLFPEAAGPRPIGRCVLVFVAATATTGAGFAAPLLVEDRMAAGQAVDPGDRLGAELFRAAQGPDFVAQLHAAVDLSGPNPVSDQDDGCVLRRAVVLRDLMAARGGEAGADDGLVRALLLGPHYRYGARSMAAILDLARVAGRTWRSPAGLPPGRLGLHVDVEAFAKAALDRHPAPEPGAEATAAPDAASGASLP
jgi:hypothetical protein